MPRTAKVKTPDVTLRAGDMLRITFDSKVGVMVHGGYGLYKVIASGSPLPAMHDTWDVEVMTTWENTENRTLYPYTVVVRCTTKIVA